MKRTLLALLVVLGISYCTHAQTHVTIPLVDGGVDHINRYGDNLFISGRFWSIGGDTTMHGLGLFHPSTTTFQNWHPEPNDYVYASIVQNGKLIVSGDFDSMGASREIT